MQYQWTDRIFNVSPGEFNSQALEVFHFQYEHNEVYKSYADVLRINPRNVKTLEEIPFLPIRFFKTHQVCTTNFTAQAIFESSGTGSEGNSYHYVKDLEIYQQSFLRGFEKFYPNAGEICILGLLPSYLERKSSSLVFMVEQLIRQTSAAESGFYLDDFAKLFNTLNALETAQQSALLIGVSFALIDFAQQYPLPLKNTLIMETGGMKGRRKEIIRDELHAMLKKSFQLDSIHSEYGMTELLSQAFSKGNGIFHCPPWMKVLVRDEEDPFVVNSNESIVNSSGKAGVINVIDLANIYSCSFIATDDAGKLYCDGSFEVLGRIDNSDIRGCSLMVL